MLLYKVFSKLRLHALTNRTLAISSNDLVYITAITYNIII